MTPAARQIECQTNELIRHSLVTISSSPSQTFFSSFPAPSQPERRGARREQDAHSAVKETVCVCACWPCCLCCFSLNYTNHCARGWCVVAPIKCCSFHWWSPVIAINSVWYPVCKKKKKMRTEYKEKREGKVGTDRGCPVMGGRDRRWGGTN